MNIKGLELYEKVRVVPETAKKSIGAGRLKGMTDINPMWRIKCLTEQFGPCGLGWYYDITKQWIEEGSENQRVAFTNINLYVKYENEWSKPIPGTGGSSFINKESKGLYTSDECFKMSLTDAISVACKALGVGADVYFQKDRTKYDNPITSVDSSRTNKQSSNTNTPTNNNSSSGDICCKDCGKKITEKVAMYSTSKFGKALCMDCQKKEAKAV